MISPDTLSVNEPEPLPVPAPPPPLPRRSGWWMHLAILLGFPMVLGLLTLSQDTKDRGAVLSPDPTSLLTTVFVELAIFAVVLLLACFFSKATSQDLMMRWRDGFWPWLRGAGYSIGLRIMVGIVVFAGVTIYAVFVKVDSAALQGLKPKVEVLIDMKALVQDPVYLWLNLTLVSFVMAGLREELWRAGMLAGMRALWPQHFGSLKGGLIASALIAIAFGLGHLPQGWGGVGMTAILGFGLGAIMVFHRSIWDAVLAHGFFDATTFAMLYVVLKYRPELLQGGI